MFLSFEFEKYDDTPNNFPSYAQAQGLPPGNPGDNGAPAEAAARGRTA